MGLAEIFDKKTEVIEIFSPSEYTHQAFASNLNRITDVKKSDIGNVHYVEVEYYNQRKAMVRFTSVVSRNETYEQWKYEFVQAKLYAEERRIRA